MMKLIAGLFLVLFSALAQAEVQVEVDPSQVTMDDMFKIIVTQTDPQQGGLPDLTPLQKNFYILGTERNVNYSIINGQAQSSSQWIISVRAQKPGVVTIPPIKIGSEQSTTITINVEATKKTQDLNTDAVNQSGIHLQGSVTVQKPYVNQQILYKVKWYTNERLLDTKYQGPQVENALLVPLGDEKRYQTVQNNTIYVVEEQSYAVFPQKSGELKIISPVITALLYDLNPQQVQAQDTPIILTVQPIPKQYTGKEWLPAKQVKLSEQYEHMNPSAGQGSTLIRTITVNAVAIPAQLLPPLNLVDSDSFKVYTEKGADHNQVQQGELFSSTEIKVTYLFDKAGKVTIPELRFPWFNTETGKEEFATLPARQIEITPSAAGVNTNNLATTTAKDENNSAKQQTTIESTPILVQTANWAWLVAAAFAIAWISTILLWIGQRRSKDSSRGQYKKSLAVLAKACKESDPRLARDALLKWGSLHWPDAPLLNLTDLNRLVRDAHLNKQLHILSQVLYGRSDRTLWRGDELLRAVNHVKRSRTRAKTKVKVLPPINPF